MFWSGALDVHCIDSRLASCQIHYRVIADGGGFRVFDLVDSRFWRNGLVLGVWGLGLGNR